MSSESPIEVIIEMLAVAFTFLLSGFLLFLFIAHLPSGGNIPSNLFAPVISMVTSTFAIFDNSFPFLLIGVVFIDIIDSYWHPRLSKAIINLGLLFILAYISILQTVFVNTINTALTFNTILPVTYATVSSPYILVFAFFMVILSVIFNFRPDPNKRREVYVGGAS